MKTFITKLRLPANPVGKPNKPVKIVWEGVDMSPITYSDINTWGEPVEYTITTSPNVYASVSNEWLTAHDAHAIGASLQNVSHALGQASVSANELQNALTRLADISFVDNETLTSIYNASMSSQYSIAETIENLMHERLRGNI